ncbi:MAG TPA: RNA polymerase subunit sigma-70 [Flavobacteriales bacterium]|nr:RNA polymerase subunit sigma-70 [Flavobacteriales bacterium]HRE73389.1 sigma-70 family RNA polymerase sigma factor [Flavobacteriales bacterium]HRE95599.1 sigma-70 family RNA polymerase sigma factor [Flavobacteriales bacterium]HRJ34883.1 sigma-70 family RNA polymerase sigma factor [Flavobacteriales bacterium]HRJ38552.1 sigma-70 family RNA polymerase sigma factor [Flavobacteriales bacterium]
MIFRKKHTNTQSDEELVRKYASSADVQIVGLLYERYSHLVFGVCLKYLRNRDDSKDAVINIFEKLLSDLKNHQVDNFKSWLHSVARNHCLMILRKSNRPGTEKEIETLEHILAEDQNDTDVFAKESSLQELESAICKLNKEQQTCIELFYLKEKSYQEITTQTGYSLNAVKSHIQNGKRNLKNMLSNHEKAI